MSLFLVKIHDWIKRHALSFIILSVVLAIVSLFVLSKIKFSEDVSQLTPNALSTEKVETVIKSTGLIDKMVVVIKNKDHEKLLETAELFVERLEGKLYKPYIKELNYTLADDNIEATYDFFFEHLPFFLNDRELADIGTKVEPKNIKSSLERTYRSLISPSSIMTKRIILKDPLFFTPRILKKLEQYNLSKNIELKDGFYQVTDHNAVVMFLTPVFGNQETSNNGKMLSLLDEEIQKIQSNGTSEIYYYGSIPAAVDNAKVIKKDVALTVGLAMILLFILLAGYFRSFITPILILLPVGLSALLALALVWLIQGEISAIILGICSVLLGIAVDYVIHCTVHYIHSDNVKKFYKDVSLPILISCVTTVAAFLMMLFLKSPALRTLGLFAGIAIFFAAIASLVYTPILIRKKKTLKANFVTRFIDYLANIPFHNNKWWLTVLLVLGIVFMFTSKQVRFEGDLSKLGYESVELKKSHKEINAVTSLAQKTVYLVSEGNSFYEALGKSQSLIPSLEKLEKEKKLSDFQSLADLIPTKTEQQKRLDKWNEFWNTTRRENVISQIEANASRLGFKDGSFNPFKEFVEKESYELMSLNDFKRINQLTENLAFEKDGMHFIITPIKVAEENKPSLINAFKNNQDVVILDRSYYAQQIIKLVKEDFNTISWLAFIAVFMVLLIAYGRIETTIVTIVPIALAWVFTFGLIGLLDIKLNIFNIVISTFIFGLGVDYCVFIQHGLNQMRSDVSLKLEHFKSSILLSSFTTFIGLGVLILAQHPALKSIASLSIFGIVCVVVVAFSIQPWLYNRLYYANGHQRNYPLTWSNVFRSVLGFVFLIVGCLVITIYTLIIKVLPGSIENKKLKVRKFMTWMAKLVLKGIPGVDVNRYNNVNETFEEPAVIISNHQSHLDILLILALNERSILLTKDWVWNNVFYGFFIRFVDFYPVTKGYEEMLPKLKEKIAQGYSIVIYPEGSRSERGKLKRFKKGAFELASQLNLDIIPIIITGIGQVMTKYEILIKKGKVTVNVLPRIKKESKDFGEHRMEKSKKVKAYYEQQINKHLNCDYTPKDYADYVNKYYLYHNPMLYWYIDAKQRSEAYFETINKHIPAQAKMYDIGCGYGYISLALNLQSPLRTIVGLDHDQEKIDIANSGKLPNNLTFDHADITAYEFEPADVYLINDVLHYINYEEQGKLLKQLAKKLNTDGIILIKDANTDSAKHARITKQESFSTKSGFNKVGNTETNLYFFSKFDLEEKANDLDLQIEVLKQNSNNSNTYYKLQRK